MSYVKLNSLQSDASSQITNTRTRLRNVYVVAGSSAGYIRIRDGGSTGSVRFEFTTPAVPTESSGFLMVELPKDGILCETSMYVELSNITSSTYVFDGTMSIMELAAGGWLHLTDGAPLELAA